MGVYQMPTEMAMSRQAVEMTPAGLVRKIRGIKILPLVALTASVVLACWFCRGHTCYMSKCTIMYLCTFNKTEDGKEIGGEWETKGKEKAGVACVLSGIFHL